MTLRHAVLFFLALTVPLSATCTVRADKPVKTVAVEFTGRSLALPVPAAAGKEPITLAALAGDSLKSLAPLARAVEAAAAKQGLYDYGRLMLVRELAVGVPLGEVFTPVRFETALTSGWNRQSRAVFVASLLDAMGYRAVVTELHGTPLVGLPVNDEQLNARTQTVTVERKFFGIEKKVTRRYILWDIEGRIGDPAVPAGSPSLVTELRQIVESDEGKTFDFRRRSLPQVLFQKTEPAVFPWPGGRAVGYTRYPQVAEYLEYYPEFHFTTQLLIERDEARRIGLGRLVAKLADGDEARFVSDLLRAVQANFKYTPGPLRSLHEILGSGEGDCDQLALVLALLLLEAGYPADSLRAVLWDDADHLGLALRPKAATALPDSAVRFQFGGSDYFVLDPTYYHRRGDELITAWGEMNPDNVDRKSLIYELARDM